MNRINRWEYSVRLIIILLAIFSPFLLLILHGYESSLSNYWETEMQPIFILSNATTSYFLYRIKGWEIPALLLLLLTAFSVEYYGTTHNMLATTFFISCLLPLYRKKEMRMIFYLYVSSVIFVPISLFVFETISVVLLCSYHLIILNRVYRLNK